MYLWSFVLLLHAGASAAAATHCTPPFRTLSSDCRGVRGADPSVVCVVLDRPNSGRPPCPPDKTTNATECGTQTGRDCEVRAYSVTFQPRRAQFSIRFPGGGMSDEKGASSTLRRLQGSDSIGQHPFIDEPSETPPVTPNPTPVPDDDLKPVPTPTIPSTPSPYPGDYLTPPRPYPGDNLMPPPPAKPPATTASPTSFVSNSLPPSVAPGPSPSSLPGSPTPTAGAPPTAQPTFPSPSSATTASPSVNQVDRSEPEPTPASESASTSPNRPDVLQSDSAATTKDERSPANSRLLGPSESNEYLNAIGILRLDPTIMELRLAGGTTELGTRGNAVSLTVDRNMLRWSPNVTSLGIYNCNIGGQLATESILSSMPTGLLELHLQNVLLRVEPNDLSSLRNLQILKMDQNYLTALSSAVSLSKLTMLDLSNNELTAFDAHVPELEDLNLNNNKFDSIPSALFSMTKLSAVQLSANPIYGIVVSASQYEFLSSVRLTLDEPPIAPPPRPVIYVSKARALSTVVGTPLSLDDKHIDLGDAVALQVGALVDLHGTSVWKLPDDEFAVFGAQQKVIATSDIMIRGERVRTYVDAVKTLVTASSQPGVPLIPSSVDDKSNNVDSNGKLAPGHQDSGLDRKHVSVVIVTLIAVAAIATLVGVIRRRRKNSCEKSGYTAYEGTASPAGQALPLTDDSKASSQDSSKTLESELTRLNVNLRDLLMSRRIRSSDLEDIQPIGAGATHIVWLVKHRNTGLLASKRLIQATSTPDRMTQFVNEIIIAADLNYPKIVHLMGVAWTDTTSSLQALFEYMPNGDLQTYLHSTSPPLLPWSTTKLRMAIDIVEALVYTHSFDPPLLHRDLRARNVLLDEHGQAKLSNFGSARYASTDNTMTTDGVGSGRWLAPEILNGQSDYAEASDVYAFGVLLSELGTHKAPYADVRNSNGEVMLEMALLERVAHGELRPLFSAECPPQIPDLANQCLSLDPEARPSAMRVAYELRGLARQLT